MNASTQQYDRIAQAEQALKDAGFVRNDKMGCWLGPDSKRAKVMRDDATKNFIFL